MVINSIGLGCLIKVICLKTHPKEQQTPFEKATNALFESTKCEGQVWAGRAKCPD